jgi:hypothetical protein
VRDADFLGEDYDQAPHSGERRQLLVLCTTPRTGSHRLGRALYDLGLGIQAEYFHLNSVNVLGTRWRIEGDRQSPGWLDAYWQEVLRRRTRNGIAAISIFGSQLGILRRLIRPCDRPIFVHLYRRSAADQVASLLALYQTKMPYENRQVMPNIPDIGEISPRAIRVLDQWLAQQNRKWRGFLADKPHLTSASEDFFEQPAELLGAILARTGIAVSPSRIEAAAQQVRDAGAHAINADIKRRVMADHAASFAALQQDLGDAGRLASGQDAGHAG